MDYRVNGLYPTCNMVGIAFYVGLAQWLAQDAYTIKVGGSSPPLDTNMKEKISKYYEGKGFYAVYVAINKEPRRVATLRRPDGSMTSMSYAKYLYTSYYEVDVDPLDNIDHINGDKMDDRIENLQVISGEYNRQKDHKTKVMVILQCPICGKEFFFEKRNLSSHPNPCCSRRCGGIKSHITLKLKNKQI